MYQLTIFFFYRVLKNEDFVLIQVQRGVNFKLQLLVLITFGYI